MFDRCGWGGATCVSLLVVCVQGYEEANGGGGCTAQAAGRSGWRRSAVLWWLSRYTLHRKSTAHTLARALTAVEGGFEWGLGMRTHAGGTACVILM